MNSKRFVLTALTLATLTAGLAACGGSSSTPVSTPQALANATAVSTAPVASSALATPGLDDQTTPTDRVIAVGTGTPGARLRRAIASVTRTPTVRRTPTATDTPTPSGPTETPTPTPVPTPDEQLTNQIQQLQSKVEDLRQAARDKDTTSMLRIQQDLEKDLPKLQESLKGVDAPYAKELQLALDDLNGGMSGDLSKLDSAEKRFNTAMGVQTQDSKIQDPQQFAGQLADKIAAFEQAVNSNDTGRILGLQKDILTDVSTAQQELEGSKSKMADQIRGALGDVQNGVGGDYGKLNSAYSKLQEAAGRGTDTVSPTPIFIATPTPIPSPSATTRAQEDLQPYANDLQGSLNKLQELAKNGSSDDIAKARDQLKSQVAKAQDAISNDQTDQAQRFRNALGAAAGAAAGDNAKIDDALKQLQDAMKQ